MAKALGETRSELRCIDRQTTFKRIERLLQRGFVKGSSRVISGLLQRGFVKGSSRVISGPSAVLRESMREAIKEEFWEIREIWEIMGDHGRSWRSTAHLKRCEWRDELGRRQQRRHLRGKLMRRSRRLERHADKACQLGEERRPERRTRAPR